MPILLVLASAAIFMVARMSGAPATNAMVTVYAKLEPSAGDAMAAIPEVRALRADPDARTIHIEGKKSSIVGQLAKIPLENGNISDIKTVSEVDNHSGRELLSIISKY